MLLNAGASQSACEDALFEASLCGEAEAVQMLICAEMVRPAAATHALVTASCRGFVEVVRNLIENGLDINCTDKVLLRSIKPSFHANVDCTPLHTSFYCEVSAKMNHADFFLELIIAGADLGMISHAGDSPIQLAKRCANASSIIDIFSQALIREASICSANLSIFSPLHFVAENGNAEVLQMLLHSSTAGLNKLVGTGITPIMVALEADRTEAFRFIVMAGADITVKSSDGKTMMSILHEATAVFRNCFEPILLDAVLADLVTDHALFGVLHYVQGRGTCLRWSSS